MNVHSGSSKDQTGDSIRENFKVKSNFLLSNNELKITAKEQRLLFDGKIDVSVDLEIRCCSDLKYDLKKKRIQ